MKLPTILHKSAVVISVFFVLGVVFARSSLAATMQPGFACDKSVLEGNEFMTIGTTGWPCNGQGNCPSGYYCCAAQYTGNKSSGHMYMTGVTATTCMREGTQHSWLSIALNDILGSGEYTVYNQTSNEFATAMSKCYGSPDPANTHWPNWNNCNPGESVYAAKMGLATWSVGCAINHYSGGPATGTCTEDPGGACNHPLTGGTSLPAGTPVIPCFNELTGNGTDFCRVKGTATSGICGMCAGGGTTPAIPDPDPYTGEPFHCGTTDDCCSAPSWDLTCDPSVFVTGTAGGTAACRLDPKGYNGGCRAGTWKGATGAICGSAGQCASGICEASPGKDYKTCQGGTVGTDCFYAGNNCVCGAGLTCEPEGSGYACKQSCTTVGGDCTMTQNCCDGATNTTSCTFSGGGVFTCVANPAGSCIAAGAHCDYSGTRCCNVGGSYACTFNNVIHDTVCTDVNACVATIGKTCADPADCCPATNKNLVCTSGTCQQDLSGNNCTGSSCGGGCGNGEKCDNGTCVTDPNCLLSLNIVPYTGPIIDFHDLVGRIYALLYPIAILIGVVFIVKAGYSFMVSEGNPVKIKEAQEDLTAAIIGLFFILLSIAILRLIIKQILGGSVGF